MPYERMKLICHSVFKRLNEMQETHATNCRGFDMFYNHQVFVHLLHIVMDTFLWCAAKAATIVTFSSHFGSNPQWLRLQYFIS